LHPWIVEGLPPKVLIHHKRMLGLDVSSSSSSSSHIIENDEINMPHKLQQWEQNTESFERPSHQLEGGVDDYTESDDK